MTITEAPRTEPVAPPAPLDWTGKYKACKDCGSSERPEVEDGLCTACYADRFGPAARRLAEARRDSRRPAAPVDEAPARRWHPEFDACLDCGRADRPYGSRGLCAGCYPASLRPGYAGNAAPPKKPGGGGVETPRPEPPPVLTRALPKDETSVAAVEMTVARHTAHLPSRPTPAPQSAPLSVEQVKEVWTGPLPGVETVAAGDLPEFEEFTATGQPDEHTPMMTLRKDGAVTVNQAAYVALGEPERVVILVSRERRILAFRKAAAGVPHARRLRGESKGNRRSVSAGPALRHYGLGAACAGRYDVARYGDVLGIALRFEG